MELVGDVAEPVTMQLLLLGHPIRRKEDGAGVNGVQLLSATSQLLGESLRAAPCWTILFRFHRRRGGEAISRLLRGDCFGRSVGSVVPSLADGRPSRPRNDMPVVHRSWLVTTAVVFPLGKRSRTNAKTPPGVQARSSCTSKAIARGLTTCPSRLEGP
jgi:hypothetical protein